MKFHIGTWKPNRLPTREEWKSFLLFIFRLLISRKSQNALRAAVAAAGVSVTIFFAVMRSHVLCFANILAYVVLVITARHPHIGAVFQASIIMSYASLIASLFGLVGLAMADKSGVGLYFIAVVQAGIATILRTDSDLTVNGIGININFIFGAIEIFYVKTPPSNAWHRTYPTLLAGQLAAVASFLCALVIFPLSAKVALKKGLAQSVRETSELVAEIARLLTNYEEETDVTVPGVVERCYVIRSSFNETRAMLSYLPFEPNIFPPWQCEPDDAWKKLVDEAEDLLLKVESVAGVLRKGKHFAVSSFNSEFGESLVLLCDFLDKAHLRGLEVAKRIESYPKIIPEEKVSVVSYRKEELNRQILRARHMQWRSADFYQNNEPETPAFIFASLIFVIFNARSIERSLYRLDDGLCHLMNERRRLRFAPLRNFFRWYPLLWKPFKSWARTHKLLAVPDNAKFLFKYLLCVAIILFPTLFVAQFSESDYFFTQRHNAISAYIVVTILVMRGIEMTLFRVFLYFTVTFASCGLAYALTVMAPTDQYIIDFWIFIWTYGALLIASINPDYIVVTFPFLLAQYFIIACQYGNGFTFIYAASRAVTVSIGCFVVAVVCMFIWPYRTTDEIRNNLRDVVLLETDLVEGFTKLFLDMNKRGLSETSWKELGGEELDEKLHRAEQRLMITRIRYIVDLTPNYRESSIPFGLNVCFSILRRLIVFRQIIRTPAEINGNYTTAAYDIFIRHLEPELFDLLRTVKETGSCISERLGKSRIHRPPPDEMLIKMESFEAALDNFLDKYRKVRQEVLDRWQEYFFSVDIGEEDSAGSLSSPPGLPPDDSVRFLAWIYSLILFVDTLFKVSGEVSQLRVESHRKRIRVIDFFFRRSRRKDGFLNEPPSVQVVSEGGRGKDSVVNVNYGDNKSESDQSEREERD
ncbi:hypothetical protein GpartN1_g642.t1 [Galdieria partita]|uniref:Uncharacterized protein n=1 Tax=Galdieria partita TaxID=83374 RepID=A0A9C7PS55_9RHOD|nr:hypothetical protein GpartN1_g642.t1 [Galdieria partita]